MPDVEGPPLPTPTPETQPYWEAARAGRLDIPRCTACTLYHFPPRHLCPFCGSVALEWVTASGRARLHTYVISHKRIPGFEPPYAIAIVELEEGPLMMTSIDEVEPTPEALQLDMPLEVRFDDREGATIPYFVPARR